MTQKWMVSQCCIWQGSPQPRAASCFSTEMTLNCFASQGLQDPSSYHTYSKALTEVRQTEKRTWPPFLLTLTAASPLADTQGLPLQNRHLGGFKVCCCSWSLSKLAPGKATFVWFVGLLAGSLSLYVHKNESERKNQQLSLIEEHFSVLVLYLHAEIGRALTCRRAKQPAEVRHGEGDVTKLYLAKAQASTLRL